MIINNLADSKKINELKRKNLANEIWPIGISFAANFANVSITGPIIVKPITSIIPKVV